MCVRSARRTGNLSTVPSCLTSCDRNGNTWAMMAFNRLAISVCNQSNRLVRFGGQEQRYTLGSSSTQSLTARQRSTQRRNKSSRGKGVEGKRVLLTASTNVATGQTIGGNKDGREPWLVVGRDRRPARLTTVPNSHGLC